MHTTGTTFSPTTSILIPSPRHPCLLTEAADTTFSSNVSIFTSTPAIQPVLPMHATGTTLSSNISTFIPLTSSALLLDAGDRHDLLVQRLDLHPAHLRLRRSS